MVFFGEWLAQRRAELGLTLRDVAQAIDVAPARLSSWERGLGDPPHEIRDACWDALKKDGEVPPLDPAPYQDAAGRKDHDTGAGAPPANRLFGRRAPRTWLEEAAVRKGTTLDAVLKAFALSPSLKSQWRAGKIPARSLQWKIVRFLDIPDELARANGWDPSPSAND